MTLVHENTPALRRMAVFDVVVNNADRKGGHVLAMADGHRYGVDHGVTFHEEHKLRTVLWGWLGEPLVEEEMRGLRRIRAGLDAELGEGLDELLTPAEVAACRARCDRLLERGCLPTPGGGWPAIPWPPF
ncbi:MAG: SCO1664 family protein [Nocardioides sp.]